jgi:ABC-type sugar transport system ATPase subunit
MSYIDIENIIKSYSSREQIIKSLSLAVQKGEFLVIVGPSGCGKSTLLRMIAGLEDIDDGVIKIEDKVINKISPADRDIAMVFQNYALYPHMNVYKNLS